MSDVFSCRLLERRRLRLAGTRLSVVVFNYFTKVVKLPVSCVLYQICVCGQPCPCNMPIAVDNKGRDLYN